MTVEPMVNSIVRNKITAIHCSFWDSCSHPPKERLAITKELAVIKKESKERIEVFSLWWFFSSSQRSIK